MGKLDISSTENVCKCIVCRDLCIGCGVCAGLCPDDNLVMGWTPEGLFQPADQGNCIQCRRCLEVCPFLDQAENETTLAKSRFGHIAGIQHTPETGYFSNAYVGYAGGDFRERGASGGMASWFLAALLNRGEVDRVILVRPNPHPTKVLFSYSIAANPDEVKAGAKSAYYPVELSQAIQVVLQEQKRYAVIGLPCALKALRLAMLVDQRLSGRIVVMAGLVCGQTKSRAFAEYLIRSENIDPNQVCSFSFREKDSNLPASNYFARVTTLSKTNSLPWLGLYGRTWMSGEFTPRPCRFCDDIFAEVADIAFMDAWLPEFVKDGNGTSIVLARSKKALQLVEEGISREEVSLEPIAIEKVIASQTGVVEQKRKNLAHRLWIAARNGTSLRKRVLPVRPSWLKREVLIARENLRAASLHAYKAAGSARADWMSRYDRRMRLACLQLALLLTPGHLYYRIWDLLEKLRAIAKSRLFQGPQSMCIGLMAACRLLPMFHSCVFMPHMHGLLAKLAEGAIESGLGWLLFGVHRSHKGKLHPA